MKFWHVNEGGGGGGGRIPMSLTTEERKVTGLPGQTRHKLAIQLIQFSLVGMHVRAFNQGREEDPSRGTGLEKP